MIGPSCGRTSNRGSGSVRSDAVCGVSGGRASRFRLGSRQLRFQTPARSAAAGRAGLRHAGQRQPGCGHVPLGYAAGSRNPVLPLQRERIVGIQPHWHEGCWPEGLYDSHEKAILLVVNETPPPEPLLPQESADRARPFTPRLPAWASPQSPIPAVNPRPAFERPRGALSKRPAHSHAPAQSARPCS